jgi:hypothetical protein
MHYYEVVILPLPVDGSQLPALVTTSCGAYMDGDFLLSLQKQAAHKQHFR